MTQGVNIFARVQAKNSLGFGSFSATLSGKPYVIPARPRFVALSALPEAHSGSTRERGTSLMIEVSPPADFGGDAIDEYRLEWSIEPMNECNDLASVH